MIYSRVYPWYVVDNGFTSHGLRYSVTNDFMFSPAPHLMRLWFRWRWQAKRQARKLNEWEAEQ